MGNLELIKTSKMKKSIKTILSLIIFFSLSLGHSQSLINKKVVGNGNITTKTLSTADYDIIKGVGFMDIHLEKGTEGNIAVTTDDNLHEYIEIKVKNKVLIVKTKKNINLKTKKGIHITVPFEDISKVTLTGSGDINTKDIIMANEFNASVVGSGDIILTVKASKVEVVVSGSGDVTLSGSTSNLVVGVRGSGDFRGFDLNSQNTNVSVSGSGDAKVVAKEKLIARVSGSGDIIYKGNPAKRDVKTSGSGDISSY